MESAQRVADGIYLSKIISANTITGLDRKGVRSHPYAPADAMLKIHLWYIACIKYCMMCFFICLCFIHFLHS